MSAPAMTPHNEAEPQYVYHVGHRKYNIDKRCAWWRRAFFRAIYLPFVRFAFRYVHIPAMDEVEITGKSMRFCWYEDGGVFDDKDCAKLACQNEFSRVKPIIKNRVYPWDTAQATGHEYPLADKPKRYSKPSFALIVKDRRQEEQDRRREEQEKQALAECLTELNHVLDRR